MLVDDSAALARVLLTHIVCAGEVNVPLEVMGDC